MDCDCPACQTLEKRYAHLPRLLALYKIKLLKRNWVLRPDPVQLAYIRAHAPWAQPDVPPGPGKRTRRGLRCPTEPVQGSLSI